MDSGAQTLRCGHGSCNFIATWGSNSLPLEEAERDRFYRGAIDLKLPSNSDTLEQAMSARNLPLPLDRDFAAKLGFCLSLASTTRDRNRSLNPGEVQHSRAVRALRGRDGLQYEVRRRSAALYRELLAALRNRR